jgi:hypothetical protein
MLPLHVVEGRSRGRRSPAQRLRRDSGNALKPKAHLCATAAVLGRLTRAGAGSHSLPTSPSRPPAERATTADTQGQTPTRTRGQVLQHTRTMRRTR